MPATKTAKKPTLKVRSGDRVQVMAGKDRGKQGRILRVEPANERVYVEGLNMVKRHMRPQQVSGAREGQTVGGVIEREGPIHVSNVMLLDPGRAPARGWQALPRGQAFRDAAGLRR